MQSSNISTGVPSTVASEITGFRDQATPEGQYNYLISGTTRDTNGAALGLCTVHLFRTSDDAELNVTTSDANGLFSFRVAQSVQCYLVAYLPGSPDVAGTSLNTLTGS